MGAQDLVIIMRRPVLMEDEGRHFFIKGPIPRKEAKGWIASQQAEYFKPGDYYIVDARKQKEQNA